MPSCCVMNCLHNSHGSLRLFRFPKDEERRKSWAVNCGRTDWFPTDYSRICEAHFDDSQFEQNRQDGKKLLKWNAVPTIFGFSSQFPNNIKRRFRKRKDSEELTLQDPGAEDKPTTAEFKDISVVTQEEVAKTTVVPKKNYKSEGKGTKTRIEEIDELTLIEEEIRKMGHEVYFDDPDEPEEQSRRKSVKSTTTPKQHPPKRRKVNEKNSPGPGIREGRVRMPREKAAKPIGRKSKSQGQPTDGEDELAQIKAEIKKLMHEAKVEESDVFEAKEESEIHIRKSHDSLAVRKVSSPRKAASRKRLPKRIKTEGKSLASSMKNSAYRHFQNHKTIINQITEVGVQTDNLESDVVSLLKAEIGQLTRELDEKNTKILELEQRLAALLQPGQIVLLQKFGANLTGAKKYVVLSKQPITPSSVKLS
ncbi:uncharacterized protein [Periplaneta americana]|uniref:uncharacterized protein n=1 Tax=Periplaneta americana TaxID=6978 RepID=UPI0037E80D20